MCLQGKKWNGYLDYLFSEGLQGLKHFIQSSICHSSVPWSDSKKTRDQHEMNAERNKPSVLDYLPLLLPKRPSDSPWVSIFFSPTDCHPQGELGLAFHHGPGDLWCVSLSRSRFFNALLKNDLIVSLCSSPNCI